MNEIKDPAPSIHSEEGTNRPAHDSTLDSAEKWQHDVTIKDVTTLSRLRMNLQPTALSVTSQESQSHRYDDYTFDQPKNDTLIRSVSTDSTTPSSYHQGFPNSPPHNVPFAPSPRSLLGTPIREQAKILTDNVLQTVGIRSSDEDEESGYSLDNQKKKQRVEEKGKEPGNNVRKGVMVMDNGESQHKFHHFLEQRQARYHHMNHYDGLPAYREALHSPSTRYHRMEQEYFSSPTTKRLIEETGTKPVQESPTFMNMTPLKETEDLATSGGGAYEFEGELSQKISNNYEVGVNESPASKNTGDFTIQSNMTMISGSTGQIPARFALHYFPEKFRIPPASTQLTRIYQFFADKPGAMITVNDILKDMTDPDYAKENVQVLINLLVRRRFLKRVGDKDAWTVRR